MKFVLKKIIRIVEDKILMIEQNMSYIRILAVLLMLASPILAQITAHTDGENRVFKVENAKLHESLIDEVTFQALIKNSLERTADEELAFQNLTKLIEQKVKLPC